MIGAGAVGSEVAEKLALAGHDVVVIERHGPRADAAEERLDALVLRGNGASPSILDRAGIRQARLLVAVTDSDEANLIACLSARSLAPATSLRTVARVRDDSYYDGLASESHGRLGIDLVIHPDRSTADDLAEAVLLPGAVNVEQFADGLLVMAEVIVSSSSAAIGQDFASLRVQRDHLVAGVMRDGALSIAYDDSTVQSGDHLFLVSGRKDVIREVAFMAGDTERVRHAMVMGASTIGMHLARRLLARGIDVKLLELDEQRATAAAHSLDGALVLHGDATSRELLLQEGVTDLHAFVAASSDDAGNLLSALTARQLGAHLTLAVLSRAEYTPLALEMGIDASVSPRQHTADTILRFVRSGSVVRLHHVVGGAEMLEFAPAKGAPIVGRPLRDAGVPRECVISAIVCGRRVTYPRGSDVIEAGDRVVVLAQPSAVPELERLFG